jgi:hypothetical protein
LRQYPYSLEVDGPPPNVDPVAYFLFELQAGYCDYYASAMVVMARSLGCRRGWEWGIWRSRRMRRGCKRFASCMAIPGRRFISPGYGWVEFEPTGSFDSPRDVRGGRDGSAAGDNGGGAHRRAAADSGVDADTAVPWLRILLVGVPAGLAIPGLAAAAAPAGGGAAGGSGGVCVRPFAGTGAAVSVIRLSAAQTPHEFAAGFSRWLPAQHGRNCCVAGWRRL